MSRIPKKHWPFPDVRCIQCGSYNIRAIFDNQAIVSCNNGFVSLIEISICGDQEAQMKCLDCRREFKWYGGECYKWTDGPPNINKPSDTWKDQKNEEV
jgi:hypothetical protein